MKFCRVMHIILIIYVSMMVKLSNENDHCKVTNQTPWFQFLTKKIKKIKKKTLSSIPKYFYSKKKKKKKKKSLLFIYLLEMLIEWGKKCLPSAIIYLQLYPFFPENPRNGKWIENKKRGKNVYLLNCLLLKSKDEIVSKSFVAENK